MSSTRRFVRWTLVIAVVVACILLAPAVGVTSPPAELSVPRDGMRHFATVGVADKGSTFSVNLVAGTQIPSGTAVDVTLGDPDCWGHWGGSGCSGYPPQQKQKHPPKGCWGHSNHPGCWPRQRPPMWNIPPMPIIPPMRDPICVSTVPNLVNRTEHQARRALTAVGLVLGNDPAGNSRVVSQVPLSGTRVLCGWAVTVTVYEPPPPPVAPSPPPVVASAPPVVLPPPPVVPPPAPVALVEPIPWFWPVFTALVLLSAGLLVGLLVLLAVRARKGQKWVRAHVRAVVGAAPDVGVEIMESRTEYSPPSCVVRLEPHADSGMQVLEEVRR